MIVDSLTVTVGVDIRAPDPVFRAWVDEGLVWLPERGMGFYPVTEQPYDADYFAKYEAYAATPMGRAITAARIRLVDSHAGARAEVVDIGIGCGAFVAARPRTWGYDVNPTGEAWLRERNRWLDPRESEVEAVTFWDVIEHVPDAHEILANVRGWVFCSLPIFSGPDHVLRSRHFRRDEHCWYWTRDGLIRWMDEHGFQCVEHGTPESLLGREDIHSFVFRRAP